MFGFPRSFWKTRDVKWSSLKIFWYSGTFPCLTSRQTRGYASFAWLRFFQSGPPINFQRCMQLLSSAQKKKNWTWMNQNAGAAWVQLHQRGLGCSPVYTLHISLYMTVCLSWVFLLFREAVQTKVPVRPFFYLCSTTLLYKACENTDVWYSVFHCGGKVSAAPMRLVSRQNRARRSAERRLCLC